MSHMLEMRRAGVLLHPTSLPGPGYCGDFGTDARRFVDLIADAGYSIWQVLPLGPTHEDGCPYQSFSVHAGNPDLIDLQWLVDRDWLSPDQANAGQAAPVTKREALNQATRAFFRHLETSSDNSMAARYGDFLRSSSYWLEDYVRFQAFREAFEYLPWTQWPRDLRDHEAGACDEKARELSERLSELRFRQFVFQCQWEELRNYANERGVLLFGDIPIYVHMESSDVWAHQSMFDLDELGAPVTVTGVPPDYFSSEGQLWGNPQYNWGEMRDTDFQWWLQRFASAAREFDVARIDHFRALEAYWEIPAAATTACDGRWVKAPGRELLSAVRDKHPQLCLVAENLGTISPEVEALRHDFQLPGMVILQFGFDGNPENPYLSHRHQAEDIVYTGTHDNNTALGWFEELPDELKSSVYSYFNNPQEGMPWMLIRQAMASPCATAIVPWQDFLGLGAKDRMNTPGTTAGNWSWRFTWDQVADDIDQYMKELADEYDRLAPASGSTFGTTTS